MNTKLLDDLDVLVQAARLAKLTYAEHMLLDQVAKRLIESLKAFDKKDESDD